MSTAKFHEGDRVRVYSNGRARLGRVSQIVAGAKRNARRWYFVAAETDGSMLGRYRSDEVQAR